MKETDRVASSPTVMASEVLSRDTFVGWTVVSFFPQPEVPATSSAPKERSSVKFIKRFILNML